MSFRQQILRRAAKRRRRIAFPEPGDPRTIEAVAQLAREGIVEPLLVADPANLDRSRLPEGTSMLDPGADPLQTALACVRDGLADGTVIDASYSAAAVRRVLSAATGSAMASSFALVELSEATDAGDAVLAFADTAWVPDPDAEQLARIAHGTADEFRRICRTEPRVALLSFSTYGSAAHASVNKVRRALDLVRAADPDLAVDGELQGDAALVPAVGASKASGSPVAGRANVLIFPDTASADIACTLVRRLGKARVLGPFLRGLAHPANVLSPGGAADDIVVSVAVTALQAG